MSARRATAVAAAMLAVATHGAAAASAGSGFFKTPSGKIVCYWVTGGSPPAMVECGVATGLRPPIPKSGVACQHLDYVGNRVSLAPTGRVQLVPCAGDAGPFGEPGRTVFLHYGRSWSADGIACRVAESGLTCRNRDGHGFFLSLRSWRTF